MARGFIIIYLFEFPIVLIMLIIAFILINVYKTRIMLKILGIFNDGDVRDIRGFIRSFFKSPSSFMDGTTSIRYYCMSCGYEHREIACAKCCSKMKRVG
jgi:hypothetical protein